MRKRLQRAAAIGMAAILCIQNAQFGLTTFADEIRFEWLSGYRMDL